tara:strand:- start:303 stop:800 length:498 start_codon:yes stop_codon:yes gene_type:complete
MVGNASISEKGFTKTVEDTYIMSKIMARLSGLDVFNITNIKISVAYGDVLVTGYVRSQEKRLKIINTIWKVDGVKKIFNEIEIGEGPSIAERTEDLILESKIKTKLLFKPGILSNNYSIDVVNKKVYVMGTSKTIDEKSLIENYLKEMKEIKKLTTIISLTREKI